MIVYFVLGLVIIWNIILSVMISRIYERQKDLLEVMESIVNCVNRLAKNYNGLTDNVVTLTESFGRYLNIDYELDTRLKTQEEKK